MALQNNRGSPWRSTRAAIRGPRPGDDGRPRGLGAIHSCCDDDVEISTPGRRHRQGGSILVYDDDRLLLDVLVTMLRREGHQVTSTHSEQEAIALARDEHFDLAVVDLGRQRSKGYDLVVVISATSPETPIVAMSAYPAQEVVRFAREHAQTFLEKPFSLAELVDVLRCILAQGQRARETMRADAPVAPIIGSTIW